MEIENKHLSTLTTNTAGTASRSAGPSEKAAPETAGQAGRGDSVSLTPTAQLLRNAESRAADTPVVNLEKVGAVRDAINDGSFEINPQRIAGKVIGLELALTDLR